jgi:crotonobetainyl-CoA:carnitine CoA-transferase CaiB-like acyl-CoA transferase
MAEPADAPHSAPPGPLAGLRVLSVEQMQALPYATQLLAFLGAEVVKIEPPEGGDSGRGARPALRDVDGRMVGATYLRNNLIRRFPRCPSLRASRWPRSEAASTTP